MTPPATSASHPPPIFIVLEGIDGAGTTTQTEWLTEHLKRLGRPAHATREPSQGPVGRLLREVLQGGHAPLPGRTFNGSAMALLFAADRLDHLDREIGPQLNAGHDVVSDRYLLSSLAYQAEETDRAWVAGLARNIRRPDLTLLIDVPVPVAAQRRAQAGRIVERYDADSLLQKVADNYRLLAQQDASVVVVDGNRSVTAVSQTIAEIVESYLRGVNR
jgi:dTMP kinase